MTKMTLETNGRGLWSNRAGTVDVVGFELVEYWDPGEDPKDWFGELRVYIDPNQWDVNKFGLIYTDELFEQQLQQWLTSQGLPGHRVSYSEQGMQGYNYVSLDAGAEFCQAWKKKVWLK